MTALFELAHAPDDRGYARGVGLNDTAAGASAGQAVCAATQAALVRSRLADRRTLRFTMSFLKTRVSDTYNLAAATRVCMLT